MNALAGPLLLVGSGKMGTALLRGWLDHGLVNDDLLVVDPAAAGNDDLMALEVKTVTGPDAIPDSSTFRAVVFAVKPQIMADVLSDYRGGFRQEGGRGPRHAQHAGRHRPRDDGSLWESSSRRPAA